MHAHSSVQAIQLHYNLIFAHRPKEEPNRPPLSQRHIHIHTLHNLVEKKKTEDLHMYELQLAFTHKLVELYPQTRITTTQCTYNLRFLRECCAQILLVCVSVWRL